MRMRGLFALVFSSALLGAGAGAAPGQGLPPLVDAAKVHLECCVEPANLTMNGDADAIRRLVLNLVSNSHKHTAEGSIRVMVRRLDEPQEPRIEIEVQDTGEGIARQLQTEVYFAHPYASWERGTNENTNGLIRQYFPKGFDFSTISADQISFVRERLNHRPRKCPQCTL